MLHLTKIAAVLLTPLGTCLLLGGLGLACMLRDWRRTGAAVLLTALLTLWVAAMPLTARIVLGGLESRYEIRTAADSPTADVAIVLGGAVRGPAPPRLGVDLAEASDRVLFAAELFRAGKVQRIVITGGNLPWGPETEPEALSIRRLLIFWGVPAERIVALAGSRTTAENAAEVKAAWPSLSAGSALLVTSAAHMPRALATFRKAGLPVMPAPTDIRIARQPLDTLDLLPDADSLEQTSDAVKEIIGYFIYTVRGDI